MKKPSKDISQLVRENVKRMTPYSSARDEFKGLGQDMVFLDANENPYDSGVNRYPDPRQRHLKELLAEQRRVTPDQLLLGNGSDEVLDLIFRVFCNPEEDHIITLPPTYGMYGVLAETNDVKNRKVALTPNFQIDLEKVMREINAQSKLLFLCSPNNPSGNTFKSVVIEELIRFFPGVVVIDEAYIDFCERTSWATRLHEFPNLIVTQTLSKAYGMAGVRLGICIASAEIIHYLNKIKPPYNVNKLTQQRALERVLRSAEVSKEVQRILEQRDTLEESLSSLSFVQEVFPSEANFVLARVDNAKLRYRQLVEKGIVVRDRSSQPRCENCLRFTVGTEEETALLIRTLNTL